MYLHLLRFGAHRLDERLYSPRPGASQTLLVFDVDVQYYLKIRDEGGVILRQSLDPSRGMFFFLDDPAVSDFTVITFL